MVEKLFRRASLMLALAMLIPGVIAPVVAVGQESDAMVDFGLGAVICSYDPGPVSAVNGTIPPDCAPVADMYMYVVAEQLHETGCTTDASGFCYVQVPAEGSLLITESSSIRTDLVPVVNPLVSYAAAQDAVFVHVVTPIVEPEPVVLPPEPEPADPELIEDEPTAPDEGEASEPTEVVDEGEVTGPTEVVDEGEVTEPTEVVDEGEATGPTEVVDEGEVTDPTEVVDDGEVTEPTEVVDEGEDIEPTEFVDDGEVTEPTEAIDESEVTDPVDGDVNATPPAEIDGDEGSAEVDQNVTTTAIGTPAAVASPSVGSDDVDPRVGFVKGADDSGLACYSEPNASSAEIGVLQNGDKVEILSDEQDGFVLVRCGDEDGYVDSTKISSDAPNVMKVSQATDVTAAAEPLKPRLQVEMIANAPSTGAACYAEPDAGSTVIKTLPNGAQFYVNGSLAGEWLPIECGSRNAYVLVAFTSLVVRTDPPTATVVEMVTGVGTGGLACLSAPHPGARVITTLPNNSQFNATGPVQAGYLPVKCAGKDGFVSAALTTAVAPISKVQTGVEMVTGVGVSGIACLAAPHPGARVLTTIHNNATLGVTGSALYGYLPVKCGGRDGYIRATLTTAVTSTLKPRASVEMIINVGTAGIACYSAPHSSSRVLKIVANNSQIATTGPVVSGYLPVQCGGKNGFIRAAHTTAYRAPLKSRVRVEMIVNAGSSGLACYSAPHSGSRVIKMVANNSQIAVTGPVTAGYLPVQCGNWNGFVRADSTTAHAWPLKTRTTVEMVVNAGSTGVACYSAPHPGSRVIRNIANNSQIAVTGAAQNGFLPVQCNGLNGFVQAAYTTAVPRPAVGSAQSVQMMTGGAACRTVPHAGATVIANLSKSDLVSVLGTESGGWVSVSCNGRIGYVQVAYTTIASQSLRGETGRTTVFNTGRSGVVCRSAPTTGGIELARFYEGQSMVITGGAVHNWVPVQCNGKNGYVPLANTTVRRDHQAPGARAAIVQGTGSSGLICRTQAGGGSDIITLPERTPVEVLSWSNGWAKVNCGGSTGYVSLRYITFNASDPWTTNEAISIDVNLSSQYMVVYQGERVIGQTYISSGRIPTFETPTGTFYIQYKIGISDMIGCSGGECWHVPAVPYQMYFTNRGHAFHGAYWHNDFGNPRSHGCINLPVGISEWLYAITPVGARVTIHY